MNTKEIEDSIKSAREELKKAYDINIEKAKKEIGDAIPKFDKLVETLHEKAASIFGWNADYHFAEISNIDVLDDCQLYNIVGSKQVKVLIPDESADKTDGFKILIIKSDLPRKPNYMDIIYFKNRLYTVTSFEETQDVYEILIHKYEQIRVLKGI